MENLGLNKGFWAGRRVFLTGHTGFKGAWLTLWLSHLGAKVYGFSLPPNGKPSLFEEAGIESCLSSSTMGDIRDSAALKAALGEAQPEIIFHLAAQALVRESYLNPVETYSVNFVGTLNLLESVRFSSSAKVVVNITTDKCYENREWVWPYREDDALGGYDPYSSSKACSEILTKAYRQSFLNSLGISVATARAGNVIGGGDWAKDRLIPDFFRAFHNGETLIVRSPDAVRPWQHVLEPLSGYLLLAQKNWEFGSKFANAWNFGPEHTDGKTVRWIADFLSGRMGGKWQTADSIQPHEANLLRLDSSKAMSLLQWKPRWGMEQALSAVIDWFEAWRNNEDMKQYTLSQINTYERGEGNG